jgi:hypothetical protein
MFRRRYVLLAGVLVALNVALLLASPGFAIRRALVNQLFGPKMVRAQAFEKTGLEWNLDRGVIKSVDGTQVTLKEADGRIEQIPLSGTTQVIRFQRRLPLTVLAPKWHVLVTWPANGAAASVDVEKTPRGRGTGYVIRRGLVNQLFGPKMVRAQAFEKNGLEWNLDRGVIKSVDSTQVTLKEADGRVQQIPLSSTTKVIRLGQQVPLTVLAPRWHVLVTWTANGAAVSVDVEKVPRGRGKGLG